jgi:hypothetical protein
MVKPDATFLLQGRSLDDHIWTCSVVDVPEHEAYSGAFEEYTKNAGEVEV